MKVNREVAVLTALVVGLSQIGICTFATELQTKNQSTAVRTKGDLDGDGSITLDDARETLKASLLITKLSDDALWAADLDDSQSVTLHDAQIVLKASLNIIKMEDVNSATLPLITVTESAQPNVTDPVTEGTKTQEPVKVTPPITTDTPTPNCTLRYLYTNVDDTQICQSVIESYIARNLIPETCEHIYIHYYPAQVDDSIVNILEEKTGRDIEIVNEERKSNDGSTAYIELNYYNQLTYGSPIETELPVSGLIYVNNTIIQQCESTFLLEDDQWVFNKTICQGENVNETESPKPDASSVPNASASPTPAIVTGTPTPPVVTGTPTPPVVTGTPTPPVVTGTPTPPVVTGTPASPVVTGTPTPECTLHYKYYNVDDSAVCQSILESYLDRKWIPDSCKHVLVNYYAVELAYSAFPNYYHTEYLEDSMLTGFQVKTGKSFKFVKNKPDNIDSSTAYIDLFYYNQLTYENRQETTLPVKGRIYIGNNEIKDCESTFQLKDKEWTFEDTKEIENTEPSN